MKKLLNVLLAVLLGVSVFSATASAASVSSVPKVKSLQSYGIDEDEVNLRWKRVKGADGYQVKYYSNGKWRNLGRTKKLYFEADDLRSGTAYRFKVRAYKLKGSKKVYGAYSKVLRASTESDRKSEVKKENSKNNLITAAKAQSVVLNHAGFKKSQVRGYESELDYERGVRVYEISFEQGRYDYDYTVNASSGKVLHWEKEFD